MSDTPQFDMTLSYVALLLEQQRYEEALPILGTLMDMNPSDREARMYRLLVLRILVQRHYLMTVAPEAAKHPPTTAKKLLATLASESSERLRLCARLWRQTPALMGKATLSRLTFSIAACGLLVTPLAFYIGASQVGITQASQASFTDTLPPIISAVDLKGFNNRTTTREMRFTSGAGEWEFAETISEPPDLELPAVAWTEIVPMENVTTKRDSGRISTAVANPIDQFGARPAASKRREIGPAANVSRKKIAGSGSERSKAGKESSAQYQSNGQVRVRESASFAGSVVHEIARGTLVTILELRGSWAKVEIRDRGITGFIRREFLSPVSLGRALES
jgi:hypothetical protein